MRRIKDVGRPRPLQALGWQRLDSRRPQDGAGLDADDIDKTERSDAIAECGVNAVSGVGEHRGFRDAGGNRGADLGKCDLRLGLERDVGRHAGCGTLDWVVSPRLGKVEAMGDWQAGVIGCRREGDNDLAVILLAELSAVLPGDADRMRVLLGGAGVVDHAAADGAAMLDDR